MGISGSGKSTWLKDKHPVVETDDLRRELLGDVNDISQEKFIFDTAIKRIIRLFDTNDTVYFGSTLVETKHRISLLKQIREAVERRYELVIDIEVFPSNPEVTKKRIIEDIKNGKDRARTLHLIDEQYKMFKYTQNILRKEKSGIRFIKYNS